MEKKYKRLIAVLVLVILALLVCLTIKTCEQSEDLPTLPIDTNAVDWNGNQQLQQVKPVTNGTHISGFKSLVFTANQTAQKVNFVNPAENGDKLFLMFLYVEDELLWSSGYVPAGSGYYDIELTRPLDAGSYKGYLKIEVYAPDGTQYNGARVSFDLTVQEA